MIFIWGEISLLLTVWMTSSVQLLSVGTFAGDGEGVVCDMFEFSSSDGGGSGSGGSFLCGISPVCRSHS